MPRYTVSLVLASILALYLVAPAAYALRVVVWYESPDPILIYAAHPDITIVDSDYGPAGRPWEGWMTRLLLEESKLVCGYLNIGFAEEWRWYWPRLAEENPPWLLQVEHPEWSGEHFVAFWRSDALSGPNSWYSILKKGIDRIAELGFNCVLFDNLDAYTYWLHPEDYLLPIEKAANASKAMIELVEKLARYAHSRRLKVIVNIGDGLDILPKIVEHIDAVLREDVFICNGEPCMNESVVAVLEDAAKKVPVIILDYIDDPEDLQLVVREAEKHGFIPVVSYSLDLDRLPANLDAILGLCKVGGETHILVYRNGSSMDIAYEESVSKLLNATPLPPACNGSMMLYPVYLGGSRYAVVLDGRVQEGVVAVGLGNRAYALLLLNDTLVVNGVKLRAYGYGLLSAAACNNTDVIVYPVSNETLGVIEVTRDGEPRLICTIPGYPVVHAATCYHGRVYVLAGDARTSRLYTIEDGSCKLVADNLPATKPLPILVFTAGMLIYPSREGLVYIDVERGSVFTIQTQVSISRLNAYSSNNTLLLASIINGKIVVLDPPLHNRGTSINTTSILSIPVAITLLVSAWKLLQGRRTGATG